jgi:AhpD family alkylhydroperoxidase
MFDLEGYVKGCSLESSLVHLLKVRASQINGCAYCLDMHTKDARAQGETEQRLYALSAWRDTGFYTDRERAALAWAETLTRISDGHVTDELFRQASAVFSEAELVEISMAVVAINAWNRLVTTFGPEAGTYQVPASKH